MKQDVTKDTYYIGMEVVRGRDWRWETQDGFPGNTGTITEIAYKSGGDYWVRVAWKDGGSHNTYRIGPKSFDLSPAHNSEEIHELW